MPKSLVTHPEYTNYRFARLRGQIRDLKQLVCCLGQQVRRFNKCQSTLTGPCGPLGPMGVTGATGAEGPQNTNLADRVLTIEYELAHLTALIESLLELESS